jgi:flagella basal body P-ring formation protein FlgA
MLLSRSWRQWSIVALAFLLPIELWGAQWLKVRLDGTSETKIGSVSLASFGSASASSPEILQRALAVEMGTLERGGNVRWPRGYIEARLKETLGENVALDLISPDFVEVRVKKIEEASSTPRAGAAVDAKAPHWETLARMKGGVPAWVRPEFEWVGAEPNWSGGQWTGPSQPWRGLIQMQWRGNQGGADSSRWAQLRVRWFARVWTAKVNIGAQTPLSSSAFVSQEIEVTNIGEAAIPAATDLMGLLENSRLRRSLLAGAPLTSTIIERLPDARAGQSLRVIFLADSGIQVSTEGSLVGNGRVGDEAKAKLKRSRKIVSGKLVAPNLMEVAL